MASIVKAIGAAISQLDEYVDMESLYEWLNDDEPWHFYGEKRHG